MVYAGRVVNITKFGAFVNVLPGRDGLLHISKLSSLAGGKRINNVEDVLTLGQAVEVRVDDIDPRARCHCRWPTHRKAYRRRPRATRTTTAVPQASTRLERWWWEHPILRGRLRGRASGGPR